MYWKWAAWDSLSRDEIYTILQLRQAIFIVEQNCPYLDADGEDHRCWHLCGRVNEELVAYIRVFPPKSLQKETVIGRVITASSIRGKGWGRELMRQAEQHCRSEFGRHDFYLGAQAHLEGFYGSLGYERCGDNYDEDGIPHLPMRKPSDI